VTQGQRAVLTAAAAVLTVLGVGWMIDEFNLVQEHGYAGFALARHGRLGDLGDHRLRLVRPALASVVGLDQQV
jgi:hypothetical protein